MNEQGGRDKYYLLNLPYSINIPYLCRPKKAILFPTFPTRLNKFPGVRERQQGVT